MGRSRRTRPPLPLLLLLGLSCFIHCVRSDPTLAPNVTTVPSASGSPVTNKTSSVAPIEPAIALQTDKPSTMTTLATPPTAASPTKPAPIVSTKAATTPTPEKASSPSDGGGAVKIITTVSKVETRPTTTGPKSSGDPPASVGTTVAASTPSQKPDTTRPAALTTATGATPPRATPLGTGPLAPKHTGTTAGAAIGPTPTKGTAPTDATTKQDATKAAGTTTAVTSSSSESVQDVKLRPSGSAAPSMGVLPPIPESSSSQLPKAIATTTESREPTTPATPAVVKPAAAMTPTATPPSATPPAATPPEATPPEATHPEATPPTATPPAATPPAATPREAMDTTAAARVFSYCLNKGHQSEEEKELVSLCQRLMGNLEDGNCTVSFRHHNNRVHVESVEISGKVKKTIVMQHFDDITKKPTDNRTLITILASCGALLIMIIILAVCASQHRKPYSGNQLHLTEELQTVEDGYHDNPTLEVMEVGVDMQEKKPPPPSLKNGGGDFNDSWIVPLDNLLKEDGPDVEDTHL